MDYEEITIEQLHRQFGDQSQWYVDADEVLCWHRNSEVIALTGLGNNLYRIEYADGTAINRLGTDIVSIQAIIWRNE